MGDRLRELAERIENERYEFATLAKSHENIDLWERILRDAGVTVRDSRTENEVNDEQDRSVGKPDSVRSVDFGGDSVGAESVSAFKEKAYRTLRDSNVPGPYRELTEGVYVTAGDEVSLVPGSYYNPESLVQKTYRVVGVDSERNDRLVLAGWFASSFYNAWNTHNLRTPDGRPVLGYRERDGLYEGGDAQHWHIMYNDAQFRIAELERDLDEMRQDRDAADTAAGKMGRELAEMERQRDYLKDSSALMYQELEKANKVALKVPGLEDDVAYLRRELEKVTAERNALRNELQEAERRCAQVEAIQVRDLTIIGPPWVRLDDETIERVIDTIVRRHLKMSTKQHTKMIEVVAPVLRDLRDGKL